MSQSHVASRLRAGASDSSPGVAIPGRKFILATTVACLISNGLFVSASAAPGAQTSGTVVISSTTTEVVVTGSVPQDGSAAAGYRVATASAGPLGNVNLQDAPLSIHVVSADLIKNLQASSASDALRYEPTVTAILGSDRSSDYFLIRGFVSSPFNGEGNAIDGMRTYSLLTPVEDKERIEVLDGVSSFLYGISAPGGMINYVTKRPTDQPLATLTIGDYGGSEFYTHLDAGGRLDKNGKWLYRFNALYGDGDAAIDSLSQNRYLLSGAVDWKPTEETTVSFDLARSYRKEDQPQALIVPGAATTINGVKYPGVTSIPDAPDATKNYGNPLCYTMDLYNRVGVGLTQKLSDIFTIRTNFRYTYDANQAPNLRNWLVDNDGHYYQQIYNKGLHVNHTSQANFFLDATFDTGAFGHKVTLGFVENYLERLTPYPNANKRFNTTGFVSSLSDPEAAALADFGSIEVSSGGPYRKTEVRNDYNFVVADQIEITKQWGLLVGATVATIDDDSWAAATGISNPGVMETAVTPAVALTFKPIPAVTTYASYMESLQNAGTVAAGYANEYQSLDPYLTRQAEVGAKATVGNVNLTAALFYMDKAAYTVDTDNNYTEGGTEVHKGIEFTATGKLTREWTILGGFTLLDAEIQSQRSTSGVDYNGKTPDGVPAQTFKLYTEYKLPFVDGLTLIGGVTYTGREYVDNSANLNMNLMTIPGVAVGEVGLRYETKVYGKDVALRFNVENVTGENYWVTDTSNFLYVGNPRTFVFSATVAWF
ncbi:MAG: TonB-dependent receptor [Chthoniobacteraceae bacterium]